MGGGCGWNPLGLSELPTVISYTLWQSSSWLQPFYPNHGIKACGGGTLPIALLVLKLGRHIRFPPRLYIGLRIVQVYVLFESSNSYQSMLNFFDMCPHLEELYVKGRIVELYLESQIFLFRSDYRHTIEEAFMNKYIDINLRLLKSLRVSIAHSNGWEFLLYLLVQIPHLERIELEMVKREEVWENRRFVWNPRIGVTAECLRETKVCPSVPL
ncbi:unnamed protein product [Prunus armeniaca]|uniref:Uncharacterized protein n=1 Tax=Prunus armeniaca TaxID=36596 RepID=A0A6J5TKN5_PRUAR|nr:unnamed protein product [Prunus armeniaca]